jgi:type II secretory pathway pseudopilin PulG
MPPKFSLVFSSSNRIGRGHRCSRAFTIMQTLMSMTVISVTVAVAVPKVKQSEVQSRATIIVADLRTFASAFEGYAQEHGSWPAESSPGVLPEEMAQRIPPTAWARIAPMGGRYNWENDQLHNGTRIRAAICITGTEDAPLPISQETLLEIDRLMDDGDLSTGSFRTGVNYDPLYILQQ